jgi:hypothetical protein
MKQILSLLTVLGAALLSVVTVNAATMTLRVASVEGERDSVVSVPISATGVVNVGALQFDLVYDPQVLRADTVTRGTPGGNALVDFNASVPGRLRIGMVTTEGIGSDGTIANASFQLTGDAGASTSLTIENARAWDTPAHLEVLVSAEAGRVSVVAASPPWLVIGAVIGLVALAFLVLLFALTRRKKPAPAYAPASVAPPRYAPPANLPEVKTPSGWSCPRCGTANNAASRFCGMCGAART